MNEAGTKRRAEIMLAAKWVDGKCVNIELNCGDGSGWVDCKYPVWSWGCCKYRIIEPAKEYFAAIFANGALSCGYISCDTVKDNCPKRIAAIKYAIKNGKVVSVELAEPDNETA